MLFRSNRADKLVEQTVDFLLTAFEPLAFMRVTGTDGEADQVIQLEIDLGERRIVGGVEPVRTINLDSALSKAHQVKQIALFVEIIRAENIFQLVAERASDQLKLLANLVLPLEKAGMQDIERRTVSIETRTPVGVPVTADRLQQHMVVEVELCIQRDAKIAQAREVVAIGVSRVRIAGDELIGKCQFMRVGIGPGIHARGVGDDIDRGHLATAHRGQLRSEGAAEVKQPQSAEHSGRRVATAPPPPPPEVFNPDVLEVHSTASLVVNANDGTVVHEKNVQGVVPIASITKLMTAMVVLDAKLPLDDVIILNDEDLDTVKGTGSRLQLGTMLTRDEMLRLALMSSENRAASALGRSYPGGIAAFVKEMNLKAMSLDMMRTTFVDSTGLAAGNTSTAQDLAKMVKAAYQYPLIRQYSTSNGYLVQSVHGRMLDFRNSNSLIVSPDWQISLQKTGYIREAGRCVVMHTTIANQPYIVVLLDSFGRLSRVGDANRIKKWIEYHHGGRVVG